MSVFLPSWAAADRRARSGIHGRVASKAERLLLAIGADPAFAESVLGDLAEEYVLRSARDGARAGEWWYVCEAVRSAPHLLASAVVQASWRGRAKLSMYLAAAALAATVALSALLGGNGAPARLVVVAGNVLDGVVVNNELPVRLAMQVLDSSGHTLSDTGVHFRWSAGVHVPVSATGIATCTQPGDAIVRASLATVSTQFVLRCRPVGAVLAVRMMNLVVGAVAEVPFVPVDAVGQRVTLLRGQLTVDDSSIAAVRALVGGKHLLRARAPGSTSLSVRIGDHDAFMSVHVYERVRTLEGMHAGQHVAVAVRLGRNDMDHWRLGASQEPYYVAMLPGPDKEHMPRFTIVGAVCSAGMDTHSFFCFAHSGASVFVHHSRNGDQTREESGMLAVWRQSEP